MKEVSKYIFQSWQQAVDGVFYWNEMVNKMSLEINKQLLAIATVIIPLTVLILTIPNPIHLTGEAKMSLYLAIGFLLVSIGCGFADMITGFHLFREYQKFDTKKSDIFRFNVLKNSKDDLQKLDQPKKSTGSLFLILQGIFLIVAVSLMSGVTIFLINSK